MSTHRFASSQCDVDHDEVRFEVRTDLDSMPLGQQSEPIESWSCKRSIDNMDLSCDLGPGHHGEVARHLFSFTSLISCLHQLYFHCYRLQFVENSPNCQHQTRVRELEVGIKSGIVNLLYNGKMNSRWEVVIQSIDRFQDNTEAALSLIGLITTNNHN